MDAKKRIVLSITKNLNVYRLEIPDEAPAQETQLALEDFRQWIESLLDLSGKATEEAQMLEEDQCPQE